MEQKDVDSNILSFVFRNKFRRPILLLFFPIIFGIILIFPPYICEVRKMTLHGILIKRYIYWSDHVFNPPDSYTDDNAIKTQSYTVDYFQWITLLSGIAFLNISFYVLTKNDSKIK
jgi:hypothetical protein